eukprot:TRINITY_DN6033_c0_g1_i1.p1 TRINITY_DN6033_c0_g1~~TRINITY_DN6033_c0_g1_i1.p1  ORF type:complete len:526 (+),score=42.72 TRINITY_DN6033_c0_g1_i1:44-1621(+)
MELALLVASTSAVHYLAVSGGTAAGLIWGSAAAAVLCAFAASLSRGREPPTGKLFFRLTPLAVVVAALFALAPASPLWTVICLPAVALFTSTPVGTGVACALMGISLGAVVQSCNSVGWHQSMADTLLPLRVALLLFLSLYGQAQHILIIDHSAYASAACFLVALSPATALAHLAVGNKIEFPGPAGIANWALAAAGTAIGIVTVTALPSGGLQLAVSQSFSLTLAWLLWDLGGGRYSLVGTAAFFVSSYSVVQLYLHSHQQSHTRRHRRRHSYNLPVSNGVFDQEMTFVPLEVAISSQDNESLTTLTPVLSPSTESPSLEKHAPGMSPPAPRLPRVGGTSRPRAGFSLPERQAKVETDQEDGLATADIMTDKLLPYTQTPPRDETRRPNAFGFFERGTCCSSLVLQHTVESLDVTLSKWHSGSPPQKLMEAVLDGIPLRWRPTLWRHCANMWIQCSDLGYSGAVTALQSSVHPQIEDSEAIRLDVKRVFRDHVLFAEGEGAAEEVLYRVLVDTPRAWHTSRLRS